MVDEIHRILSLRIREERRRAGYTLDELGERAGITGAFIAHIEAGRKRPTLGTLAKLAHALGSSASVLLQNNREQARPDGPYLDQFARCLREMTPRQKQALIALVRAGKDLTRR